MEPRLWSFLPGGWGPWEAEGAFMQTSKPADTEGSSQLAEPPRGGSGTCSWGGALGGAAGSSGELPLPLLLARSGWLSGHRGLSTASSQPVILFKQPCCLKGQAWPRGYHEPHNCPWRVGRGRASRTQHPPPPAKPHLSRAPGLWGPAPPPCPPQPARDAGSHPLGWGQAGPFAEPPSGPWGWGPRAVSTWGVRVRDAHPPPPSADPSAAH